MSFTASKNTHVYEFLSTNHMYEAVTHYELWLQEETPTVLDVCMTQDGEGYVTIIVTYEE